jgi:hypothetical protein
MNASARTIVGPIGAEGSMHAWEPRTDTAEPAAYSTSGRWLTEASDLVATDAEARIAMWSADRLPVCFPRDWPAAFKSEALKRLLNKSMLRGARCRAVPPPSDADLAAVSHVPLQALHSFSNAERIAAATGRSVVKGFLVLELSEAPPSASFVAIRHWWNANSAGAWVDLTPPLASLAGVQPDGAGQRLLVESPLGEKEAAPLSASGRAFACALTARLAAGQLPPAPPPAEPPSAAASLASSDRTVGGGKAPRTGVGGGTAQGTLAPPTRKSPGGGATTLNYSKWDAVDVSDEEAEEADKQRNATVARRAAEQRRQEEEMAAAVKAQQDSVTSAMDAAVAASTAGNMDALDQMSAAARAAAPLSAEMEELIASLPLAAQIAARAAAANAAGSRGADAGAAGSLKEMLAGADITSAADDPGLEDFREFFNNDAVAEAAAEQRAARAAELRARAEAAVAASARKEEQANRVEWLGDWA